MLAHPTLEHHTQIDLVLRDYRINGSAWFWRISFGISSFRLNLLLEAQQARSHHQLARAWHATWSLAQCVHHLRLYNYGFETP